jgi:malate permease and related proteins
VAGHRGGERAQAAARRLLSVVLFGLMPPVYFVNIARLEFDPDIGVGIVLGWVALLGAGGLAYLAARGMRLPPAQAGVITNAGLQGNTGYLGLPLSVALLGSERLPEAVAFDALAQGPVFFLGVFGVGAALGTRAGEGWRRRLRFFFTRNPVLWAVAAGLVAPDALAPDVAVDVSRVIIFALLPTCFLAVGIVLASEGVSARFDRRIGAAVGFRMVVAPALLIALAAPLIDLPPAYALLAATPAGINGITVAHAYGLDVELAASTIAWTTAIFLVVASAAVALT